MRWWWRKRQDNFEWRDYVRTTILVRRNERRQKVEDAKQAAIFGVKHAGQKGVEAGAAGLGAAGRASKAAASAVGRGGVAVGSAVGQRGASFGAAMGRRAAEAARASKAGLYAGGAAVGRASSAGFRRAGASASPHVLRLRDGAIDRLEPAIQGLLRPSIAMPLTIVALAVGAGAIFRWAYVGFDHDVAVAGTIAIAAALLTLLPRAAVGDVPRPIAAGANLIGRIPGLNRMPPMMAVGGLAALLLAAGAGYWVISQSATGIQTAAISSRADKDDDGVPKVDVTRLPDLKGRGSAVAGDLVKVSGTTVKLAGIEAPEGEQRCGGANDRGRRCADAARDALARLIRSQQLICQLAGSDDSGRRLASCKAGEKDVAAEMVRGGHVFAATGFFARYGSEEGEARSAKTGLWQGDGIERPAEYRAKRWEEAKRDAPQGCPIKGSVARGSRTYVLPWSPSYERVRVRENRGERWFCSEQEARAAGWRPTTL